MAMPRIRRDIDSRDRPRVAVIGAGMAGMTCAAHLKSFCEVTVFEKSQGTGGRMATRRAGTLRFDHGAQYFTVRTRPFQKIVDQWLRNGEAEPWEAAVCGLSSGKRVEKRPFNRYVGTPQMNSVVAALGSGIEIVLGTRVVELRWRDEFWELFSDKARLLGNFELVVLALPAPQAVALAEESEVITRTASRIEMDPCWSLMAHFPEPVDVDFDAAFVEGADVSWVARNNSKPARPDREAWVIHASPEWSLRHLEEDPERISELLLASFREVVPAATGEALFSAAHRWRYAKTLNTLNTYCLLDRRRRLGACGDWCLTPRVEGAFLSGQGLAELILKEVSGGLG